MIQEQISRAWNDLSNAQRKIAEYVLGNIEDAAFMTAEKLAEACDVSEASVIRFANRLGYERYSELQTELRIGMREKLYQHDRFERSASLKSAGSSVKIAQKSMLSDIKGIEKTMASIKESTLNSVASHIVSARNVYVIGTHSTYGIACYFANTLGWIRDNVFLIDEVHSPTFDRVADSNSADVFVAIGFPPYTSTTVRYIEGARKRGTYCIGITDLPLSPIAMRAHETIYVYDEKLFFDDNLAPTVSVLSALLALIGAYDYEAAKRHLKQRQDYWNEIGFYHKESR